jgi:SAM-dependent methyltransferase
MATAQEEGAVTPQPDEVRRYLLSFDMFADNPQEGVGYVTDALRRFLLTLELVPPGGPGQRLLELGAGPYFLTLLLTKYRRYELELANFYGAAAPPQRTAVVRSATFGEEHHFPFRNFNAEFDPFPYADEAFDVVLCCEIIEHLTMDPTHMLGEIHRVLRPNGRLLLTTPNVFNLAYAWRLLRGLGNIFHPYSGYGIYGRHQREYTPAELTDLLRGVGFAPEQVRLADIHPYPPHLALLKRLRPLWRDNMFVVARKAGPRREYYPETLYISRHKLNAAKRTTSPSDEVQP